MAPPRISSGIRPVIQCLGSTTIHLAVDLVKRANRSMTSFTPCYSIHIFPATCRTPDFSLTGLFELGEIFLFEIKIGQLRDLLSPLFVKVQRLPAGIHQRRISLERVYGYPNLFNPSLA